MRNENSPSGSIRGMRGGTLGSDYPSWWTMLRTFPFVIGLMFFLFSPRPYQKAAHRQQTAVGIVKTHDPGNHNQYGYEFSVGGKAYSGSQIPGNNGYQIGQEVLVYFDPLDPRLNSLTNFSDATENLSGPIIFCAFGLVGFALFIFFQRRAYRSNLPRSIPNQS
jgi:hypothetical protein